MKTLLYIICFVLSVNAFTLKPETNIIPESFGIDYKEIIMNMESSCSDTIMNAINQVYGDESTLLLKIKIDCDFEKANRLFKIFYEKYLPYFDNNKYNNIIDSITHSEYPQYDLMWGIRFNSIKAPYIKRVYPYDVYMGNNNQCVFYSVIADNKIIGTIKASFNGRSLDYIDVSHKSSIFYYKIPTNSKNINDVDINKILIPTDSYVSNTGHLIELD